MKLSITMLECLALMKENGGKLMRFPGGFWAQEGWCLGKGSYFRASTIQTLVNRGVATYTVWKDRGCCGKFPIEAMLLEKRP